MNNDNNVKVVDFTHLRSGLVVPRDGFFDEITDEHVAVSARDDHLHRPEAHGYLHSRSPTVTRRRVSRSERGRPGRRHGDGPAYRQVGLLSGSGRRRSICLSPASDPYFKDRSWDGPGREMDEGVRWTRSWGTWDGRCRETDEVARWTRSRDGRCRDGRGREMGDASKNMFRLTDARATGSKKERL